MDTHGRKRRKLVLAAAAAADRFHNSLSVGPMDVPQAPGAAV